MLQGNLMMNHRRKQAPQEAARRPATELFGCRDDNDAPAPRCVDISSGRDCGSVVESHIRCDLLTFAAIDA
jgi:hypothetical protein